MKTPTIKELRALAKRKGMVYDEKEYQNNTFCELSTRNNDGLDITGWSDSAPMRKVIMAALRALPDKKVAR